jgi:hypothetical protein
MNIAVIERELTDAERSAGWSHVYETLPRVTGRTFTLEPLPADLSASEGFALMAKVSGFQFTLFPLANAAH